MRKPAHKTNWHHFLIDVLCFGLLGFTFLFILFALCPTSEQNCIQEVKQGHTLSQEPGKLRRNTAGMLVCTRSVAA